MLYLLRYFILAKIKPINALTVADLPCVFLLRISSLIMLQPLQ